VMEAEEYKSIACYVLWEKSILYHNGSSITGLATGLSDLE